MGKDGKDHMRMGKSSGEGPFGRSGSDSIHNDMAFGLAMCASDLTRGLKEAGLDVLDVRATGPSGQTAYAKIRAHTGGDSKQALYVMLTCSRQTLPKIAMVFDEDVDIWNDAQIL